MPVEVIWASADEGVSAHAPSNRAESARYARVLRLRYIFIFMWCPYSLSSFAFPEVVWKQTGALLGLWPPHCHCRSTNRPSKYQSSFSAHPTSLASFRLEPAFRSAKLPPEAAGDRAAADKSRRHAPPYLPLRPTGRAC